MLISCTIANARFGVDSSQARAGTNSQISSPRCAHALTNHARCSTFVLMEVETLGVARSLGWKVHMHCADGYREGTEVDAPMRLSQAA